MKKKILIIENDREIRSIVEFILSEEGFDTQSSPEPETLAEVLQFKPDLILIDEFINSRPGHRLCHKIKQEPKLTHLPVIILSTSNDIELIVKECNANDYIRKPFDIEEMVDKVLRVIGNHSLPIN
jgi:two-component system phosphate regulon response regulator PhoB